jgi:glycosyltransferase involved in cell wall biosynthesis
VSVVIPTRNEEHTIAGCLGAVLAQDYPAGRMEVLVVDGRSTDRTRAIVAELAATDPHARVQLLDNPHRIASTALNIGIRAARGAIIARVDGHTIIAPDHLRR